MNGKHGTKNPAIAPSTSVRLSFHRGRQTAKATKMGMIAHILIAPAKPKAMPANAKRREGAILPPENMAIMPMRQKQTRYGSSNRDWSAATANGKHARAVPAIIMAPTPRWRTAIAARTAFNTITRSVTRRAPAMAPPVPMRLPRAASGVMSRGTPGGCSSTNSR